MRISDFRSVIEGKFRGVARPNLFAVTIYTRNRNTVNADELTFWCKSTTLPGINLRTFEYASKNYGLAQALPFGINSEPLNCTFMLDSSHLILGFFHKWMQEIYNYNSVNSMGSSNGLAPYEMGYLSEYAATMEIHFYSADNNGDKYTMKLHDVFPTNISSLNLSWDDNDSYATMPVQFSYSKFEVDALVEGSGVEALERMKAGINGVYFESGRNMYTNDSVSSGSIQNFIDLEARINLSIESEGRKLLRKLF